MQQIQQLCGADDDPREHYGIGGSKHRDPYLTQNLVPITDLFEHLRATIAEATLLYQLGASVLET
jgi:hypothetical protein